MNAIEFVKEKLSHLKQYYNTEEEMVEDFLRQGENEVTIAVHEVIKWLEETLEGSTTTTTTTQ